MASQLELQLGKKGLTNEFLEELKKRFENNKIKNIKISVLKSVRENGKKDVKKYADEVKDYLGDKFTCRVIGFGIFLKKWRRTKK